MDRDPGSHFKVDLPGADRRCLNSLPTDHPGARSASLRYTRTLSCTLQVKDTLLREAKKTSFWAMFSYKFNCVLDINRILPFNEKKTVPSANAFLTEPVSEK